MSDKCVGGPSLRELSIIIISSSLLTLLMSYLDAYERLYLFTHMHDSFAIGEFAVFLPAFLAMGFILLSYQKIQQLESEIAKRKEVEEALRNSEKNYKALSITDDLTQLYNSRHFHEKLKTEIDRTARYHRPLSLLLMDIDDFKHYNDAYGHLEGNKVLASLGKVIRGGLRSADSGFRYGGEEFTVILPETDLDGSIKVAERIRKVFEAEIFYPKPDEAAHSTVSIGVSQYQSKEAQNHFVKRTDNAMYEAKKEGKNRTISQ